MLCCFSPQQADSPAKTSISTRSADAAVNKQANGDSEVASLGSQKMQLGAQKPELAEHTTVEAIKGHTEEGGEAQEQGLLRRSGQQEKKPKPAAENGVHPAQLNPNSSYEAPYLAACEILERSDKAGSHKQPLLSGSQPSSPQQADQGPISHRIASPRGQTPTASVRRTPVPMVSATEAGSGPRRQGEEDAAGCDLLSSSVLTTSSQGNLLPEGNRSAIVEPSRRSFPAEAPLTKRWPAVPPALLPSVPSALAVRGSSESTSLLPQVPSALASTRGSASISMDWARGDLPAPMPPEVEEEAVAELEATFPVGIGVDLPLPEQPSAPPSVEPTMSFPTRAKSRKQVQIRDDSAKEPDPKYRSKSAKGTAPLPQEPINKGSHQSHPPSSKNRSHRTTAARRAARMWSQNGTEQANSSGHLSALLSQEDPLANYPRFQRLRHLNSGSSGFVYLCLDKVAEKEVAIKFVPRGRANAKAAEREILNLRLCAMHPYIIHLREVFLTREHLAIVFEYAPGGNLARYIETYQSSKPGRGLSEERTRWIFQQIVVSIDFCHKMGIANRDIKLENVLLVPSSSDPTQPPVVKLCDFGFSKDENADSTCKTACGTPECVAPEVLTQANYDGKASDIWSLGVMLYAMLTGTFPFSRPADDLLSNTAGMRKLFSRIANAQYPKPSHLSPDALDLLARMLRPAPEERINIAEILSHPWFGSRALESVALGVNQGLQQMPDVMLTGFAQQTEEEILEITRAAALRSDDAQSTLLKRVSSR